MKLSELIEKIKDPNQYESRKETLELVHACEKMRAALEYYAKPVMRFDGYVSIGKSSSMMKTRHSMTRAREVLKELG